MTTPEYRALVEDCWTGVGGSGRSTLDPFEVLRASKAPSNAIAAFELARDAGYEVRFAAVSSHVGWFAYVAAIAVTDPAVRAAFDELDRIQEADEGFMLTGSRRWFDGDWHWITDGD